MPSCVDSSAVLWGSAAAGLATRRSSKARMPYGLVAGVIGWRSIEASGGRRVAGKAVRAELAVERGDTPRDRLDREALADARRDARLHRQLPELGIRGHRLRDVAGAGDEIPGRRRGSRRRL